MGPLQRLGCCWADLLNVLNFTQPWFQVKQIYVKKSVNFVKIKIGTSGYNFNIIQQIQNFNQIPSKYLVNILLKLKKKTFALHFLELLPKKSIKCNKKLIYDKTEWAWSNKFTPGKKILHKRWLRWFTHFEGLLLRVKLSLRFEMTRALKDYLDLCEGSEYPTG